MASSKQLQRIPVAYTLGSEDGYRAAVRGRAADAATAFRAHALPVSAYLDFEAAYLASFRQVKEAS